MFVKFGYSITASVSLSLENTSLNMDKDSEAKDESLLDENIQFCIDNKVSEQNGMLM